MKGQWNLVLRDGKPVSAAKISPSGQFLREVKNPKSITELCRRTRKSRRQIYRDIRAGKFRPLGKFLGEWLVETLPGRLPPDAAPLFPEYDLALLDPDQHREWILPRLLQFGGRKNLHWAFSFYGENSIRRLLLEEGSARLDRRAFRFWCLYFGIKGTSASSSMMKGRRWGGGA